jgi:hypothetical protein
MLFVICVIFVGRVQGGVERGFTRTLQCRLFFTVLIRLYGLVWCTIPTIRDSHQELLNATSMAPSEREFLQGGWRKITTLERS